MKMKIHTTSAMLTEVINVLTHRTSMLRTLYFSGTGIVLSQVSKPLGHRQPRCTKSRNARTHQSDQERDRETYPDHFWSDVKLLQKALSHRRRIEVAQEQPRTSAPDDPAGQRNQPALGNEQSEEPRPTKAER